MSVGRFVIFANYWGTELEGSLPRINEDDFIVCADGGYAVCCAARLRPDVVIGDFDSLSQTQINEIDEADIEKILYPEKKDDTDMMLCVKYGIAHGFRSFLIVGGIGGEISHTFANLQILSFLTDMECEAEIITPWEKLFMADGETVLVHREAKPSVPVSFSGEPGKKFSVFSYAERSSGVSIVNAEYPLDDVVLTQSYPIGVNNAFSNHEPVTVSVRYGRLLVITER